MPKKQAGYGQPAVYNLNPVVLDDGDFAGLQVDQNGYLKISGVVSSSGGAAYNATAPVLASGATTSLQTDQNGNLRETMASRLDPVNDGVTTSPLGHSYNYISTAATTTAKSGAGVLQSVTVEGGTAGTVIIYDNTAGSGTIIASFDSTAALAQYLFNVAFVTGLTIVTSAATKLTVTWR